MIYMNYQLVICLAFSLHIFLKIFRSRQNEKKTCRHPARLPDESISDSAGGYPAVPFGNLSDGEDTEPYWRVLDLTVKQSSKMVTNVTFLPILYFNM